MLQRIPFIITLLTMLTGVFIAILFGVNEDIFKGKIAKQLENNKKIQSIVDPVKKAKKIEKEKSKNWRYYQRFHFHATGIGAMSMVVVVYLYLLIAPGLLNTITSFLVSVGGFLYPFVWLFAAIWGPEIGRSVAKEKFAFFGYMGGLFLIGILITIVLSLLQFKERK
jgi:uncharacterized membrane protein